MQIYFLINLKFLNLRFLKVHVDQGFPNRGDISKLGPKTSKGAKRGGFEILGNLKLNFETYTRYSGVADKEEKNKGLRYFY